MMNFPALFAISLAMFTMGGCAVSPSGPTPEGLASVYSSTVDELYVRPNADLTAYREVLIDAVPVQFRSDYLTRRHAYNRELQNIYPPYQNPEALGEDLSELMHASLAAAFKAAGYKIVDAPAAGAMRITARVDDLFINAPDQLSPSTKRAFTRDAGEAKLALEARDAQSDLVMARVAHHAIAREVTRLEVADTTSNRMWFDALFHRWATNCVAELAHR